METTLALPLALCPMVCLVCTEQPKSLASNQRQLAARGSGGLSVRDKIEPKTTRGTQTFQRETTDSYPARVGRSREADGGQDVFV